MEELHNVPPGHNQGLLPPNPAGIPLDLQEWPHWVAWVALPDGARIKKRPINARTGDPASVADRSTWGSFQQAVEGYRRFGLTGIGVVLGPKLVGETFAIGPRLCGLDFDHCVDPLTGSIEPRVLEAVAAIDSYAEFSPSGSGLHVFAFGRPLNAGRKVGRFEAYDWGRFLTVTGRHVEGTHNSVRQRADALLFLQAHFTEVRL